MVELDRQSLERYNSLFYIWQMEKEKKKSMLVTIVLILRQACMASDSTVYRWKIRTPTQNKSK